jgi:cytochrome b subunit of formate dehydrogenase
MHKIYVNPLPVRIWHWTNAIGFLLLIATGLQIRYVGLIGLMSFKTAVVLHNWIGFVLIANFFVWLLFYLFSDKIKVYHPELSPMKYFRASFRQMQFYGYGIFRGDPNPHHVSAYRKFNPLQSMMYQIIMMLLVPDRQQIFGVEIIWPLLQDRFERLRIHRISGVVRHDADIRPSESREQRGLVHRAVAVRRGVHDERVRLGLQAAEAEAVAAGAFARAD